tara:strand:- start:2706 stop:2882 length:177 start_codon:yes stop_codon:yes gene_type:complete
MRDLKGYTQYQQARLKENKEKGLNRFLRKEVNIGGHGTRDYVIKSGPNKGRVAKNFQK